jgi:hypothetical protein
MEMFKKRVQEERLEKQRRDQQEEPTALDKRREEQHEQQYSYTQNSITGNANQFNWNAQSGDKPRFRVWNGQATASTREHNNAYEYYLYQD